MKFRTEIKLPEYPFRISYADRIMFIGSCFSDNIGRFFEENGFDVSVNPFGTLFNPISIAFALKLAMNPSLFDERLVVNNGVYGIVLPIMAGFPIQIGRNLWKQSANSFLRLMISC
ncbi:MAG: GSCFA domain-containing protein [Bacteroidales bacterium]|nr:GSCFA domain-containing protein [Bacteroidales bacterium]